MLEAPPAPVPVAPEQGVAKPVASADTCSAAGVGMISAVEYMALITEVKILAAHIDATRRDIAALGADQAVKSHVSAATDELDAVVVHTAEATGKILDVCERLDSASFPGCEDVVAAATARIYEACSFQDVTGQRVAKVVRTLQDIEGKIAQILRVFGEAPAAEITSERACPPTNSLLNGPQHPTRAMDQGAVDALLDAGR